MYNPVDCVNIKSNVIRIILKVMTVFNQSMYCKVVSGFFFQKAIVMLL